MGDGEEPEEPCPAPPHRGKRAVRYSAERALGLAPEPEQLSQRALDPCSIIREGSKGDGKELPPDFDFHSPVVFLDYLIVRTNLQHLWPIARVPYKDGSIALSVHSPICLF